MSSLVDINKYIEENIIKGLFDKKLAEQFYKQVIKDRTEQNIVFDYRDGKEDAILYINQLLISNSFLNSKEWLLFQDDNDIRAHVFVYQCFQTSRGRDDTTINTLIMYVENKNWQALFQDYVFYKAFGELIIRRKKIYETIKAVKKYEWLNKNSFKQQLQINKDNCSICSDVVIDYHNKYGSTTDCGHNFHKKCIDSMCRKVFKKEVQNAKIRCPSCGYIIFINCYENIYCIRNYY